MRPTLLSDSHWAATAAPGPATPRFSGHAETDVAIVGGGYCGLSCALHLAEAGVEVVLLEAHEPGFGGSGRNNGHCTPDWIYRKPAELERFFGQEYAPRINRMQGAAAALVFGLIRKHGIDCEAVQSGTLNVVRDPALLAPLAMKAEQWRRLGFPVDLHDRAGIGALVGTDAYAGGIVYREGGHLHPLAYARGLARAAQKAGAAIHGASRVIALEPGGETRRHRLVTAEGSLKARRVVIATNAHRGGLSSRLDGAYYRARAFGLASEPLPEDVRRGVLPGDHAFAETLKGDLFFFFDPAGRLITGGGVGRGVNDTLERAAADFMRHNRGAFPQLDDVRFTRYWQGWIDMVPRRVVGVHEPAHGLYVAIGFSGRGVPTATAVGRDIAGMLATGDRTRCSFPLGPLTTVPFPRLGTWWLDNVMMRWHAMRD